MKQEINKILGFFAVLISPMVFADPNAMVELQKRLALSHQYSADFEQTVRSSQGEVVQQGKGKFYVKRPNLFRMDTTQPQQNQIISDGKTLWFYDPFVEQVTANWLKEAVNNTPFVLLTNNDKQHWQAYTVSQNADSFSLKPKAKSHLKQFDIRIDPQGVIKGFSTIEQDGQSNLYVLRNITSANIADALFKFKLPKGVELDDQRAKRL